MVRNGIPVVLCLRPCGEDCIVYILEDLIRRLFVPLGHAPFPGCFRRRDQHVRVVHKPGCPVKHKPHIRVLVHMLVIGHPHAVAQQAFDIPSCDIPFLHVHPHDACPECNPVSLIEAFTKIRLNHRDPVRPSGVHEVIPGTSRYPVINTHGRYIIHPAAAYTDREVSRIGEACERRPYKRIFFF